MSLQSRLLLVVDKDRTLMATMLGMLRQFSRIGVFGAGSRTGKLWFAGTLTLRIEHSANVSGSSM